LKKFFQGFAFAFAGFKILVTTERNFKIHLFAFVVVATAGFYFKIDNVEWLAILIISSLILTAEALNSALEKLCNHLHPEYHLAIKNVKDLSAAAVLISSIIAVIIAGIIFSQPIYDLLIN